MIVRGDTSIICVGSGGWPIATNNQMELMGALEGLKALLIHPEFVVGSSVELVSDSQYTLGLANGSYSATKNTELADEIRQLCVINQVSTRWVRGHLPIKDGGDPVNHACDALAKHGKDKFLPAKVLKRKERKKFRKKLTRPE